MIKKLTKSDELYQDSENPVIHNGPRLHQLVKTNQK